MSVIIKVIIEGFVQCAMLFAICAIGIRNGAVNMVFLYENDVMQRVVENGLTTPEKIKKGKAIFMLFGVFFLYLLYTPVCVYAINGARGFLDGFLQMLGIIMLTSVFDRIVIDLIWVGHTKAWIIPGTEDLRPYIPFKTHIKKWFLTIVEIPAVVALLAWVMSLIIK